VKLVGEAFNSGPLSEGSGHPNVVFVVVESWEKPLSSEIDQSLIGPYLSDKMRMQYTVSVGTVPFKGPTIGGELRELCSSTLGIGVIIAPASRLRECLPQRFARIGYHTVAIHGF
jgi:phosphoglycerol transferase MdoB-like AlkP superfamily enzyme